MIAARAFLLCLLSQGNNRTRNNNNWYERTTRTNEVEKESEQQAGTFHRFFSVS